MVAINAQIAVAAVVFITTLITVNGRVLNNAERMLRTNGNRNTRSLLRSFGSTPTYSSPRALNHMLKQPILSFDSWFGGRTKRDDDDDAQLNALIASASAEAEPAAKDYAYDDVELVVGGSRALAGRVRRAVRNNRRLILVGV